MEKMIFGKKIWKDIALSFKYFQNLVKYVFKFRGLLRIFDVLRILLQPKYQILNFSLFTWGLVPLAWAFSGFPPPLPLIMPWTCWHHSLAFKPLPEIISLGTWAMQRTFPVSSSPEKNMAGVAGLRALTCFRHPSKALFWANAVNTKNKSCYQNYFILHIYKF